MKFQHYNLGQKQRGDVVEVTLSGSAANVRLLDSLNFHNYKSGRRHRYYGGLVTKSPARLVIPHSGSWNVTVDMQGLRGSVRSTVNVIPQAALNPLPEYSPPSIANLVRPVSDDMSHDPGSGEMSPSKAYDVFVSHASEDKESLVLPLANCLQSLGLKVWYDDIELRIGDSLRRKIDRGLAQSRFSVVVISPSFLSKQWTQYELDGLVTLELTGEQVILPIWHKITKQEVIEHSPSLADKVARSTSDFTVEEIAQEIAEVIKSSG